MAFLGTAHLRFVLAAALLYVAGGAAAYARAQSPAAGPGANEANVKAVFLFNFAKYVTWPPLAMGEQSPGEVRLCVPARDSFFALVQSAVEGENVDGKPLVAVALGGLDDARTCQILYVGGTDSLDGKAWLSAVRGRQVLTVGDGPLNDQTVIAFVRENNRIRFDINRAAANGRGLNISSKLLRLARQVRDR